MRAPNALARCWLRRRLRDESTISTPPNAPGRFCTHCASTTSPSGARRWRSRAALRSRSAAPPSSLCSAARPNAPAAFAVSRTALSACSDTSGASTTSRSTTARARTEERNMAVAAFVIASVILLPGGRKRLVVSADDDVLFVSESATICAMLSSSATASDAVPRCEAASRAPSESLKSISFRASASAISPTSSTASPSAAEPTAMSPSTSSLMG
mmetsp:Transcript_15917/g.49544  ORF Transcript_15917/g.49544 Transcript_15917/m.49544 type:complete len:215 (+) Transcript_15917:1001-1645(+)